MGKIQRCDDTACDHVTATLPEDKVLKILLKDNGIGFAPRYTTRIFQTFTSLYAKDQYEGTGLGLALCKKIIDRHGGRIVADSVVNAWASFTMLLPL